MLVPECAGLELSSSSAQTVSQAPQLPFRLTQVRILQSILLISTTLLAAAAASAPSKSIPNGETFAHRDADLSAKDCGLVCHGRNKTLVTPSLGRAKKAVGGRRRRRSPSPSPLLDMNAYGDASDWRQQTYDVVVIESGPNGDRGGGRESIGGEPAAGRDVLLRELEDVAQKLPLPLPLPLKKMLQKDPLDQTTAVKAVDSDRNASDTDRGQDVINAVVTAIPTVVPIITGTVIPILAGAAGAGAAAVSAGVQIKKPIKKLKKKKNLYNKLLLNSLKETKKELLIEKRKKSVVKLGAPQVKIILIPSGTVLSPDGTFVAAPPHATVGNGVASLPSSAQEGESHLLSIALDMNCRFNQNYAYKTFVEFWEIPICTKLIISTIKGI